MVGYITTRHLILHGRCITHEFGWKFWLVALYHAVFTREKLTFLEMMRRYL